MPNLPATPAKTSADPTKQYWGTCHSREISLALYVQLWITWIIPCLQKNYKKSIAVTRHKFSVWNEGSLKSISFLYQNWNICIKPSWLLNSATHMNLFQNRKTEFILWSIQNTIQSSRIFSSMGVLKRYNLSAKGMDNESLKRREVLTRSRADRNTDRM